MSDTSDKAGDEEDFDWDEETDGVASDSLEDDLDLAPTAQTFAPRGVLPDGATTVVLSGAGAGSAIVPHEVPREQDAVALLSRDSALSRSSPVFMVHRPHQNGILMPRLLASVASVTRGRVAAAASVALPQATNESLSTWLSSCVVASVTMADPLGYLKDPTIVRVPAVSDRARRWRPYLAEAGDDIPSLLELQRTVGANLLLTPGRALDPTNAQTALDAAFAQGDDALANLGTGERLALNLTLPATWLSSESLRAKLFAQLLDQEQFDVWHIRVQWPSTVRSLHQPLSLELLTGYKRLSQLAADEGHALLLPQTGLTGWLQLAFGGHGFGSGLFGSGQAFKEHSQGGSGGQPEVERYFEPTLLHPVERAVHDAMRRADGYVTCDCPYCPALHAKSDWDHTLARLHLMHWQGRLAGRAFEQGKSQEAAIRGAVRAAVDAAAAQPLAGISLPRHLTIWDQLL
ncbi:hypothetical protein [Microbacterium sp. SS28]|uniref:hypothetical protein n=1 Tax=Microbacterium sp. SS28 TaxID=2919948 RepID=UPI001FA95284|nr:hypothetical protein [Microbacterium sp. SS28]